MTLFGIELWAFVTVFAMFGFTMHKTYQYDKKISKNLFQARARYLKAIHTRDKRLAACKQQTSLPPAFQEENWMRNVWSEPLDENVIMATTGCELTDAIYAAAQRADIDIVAFEKEHGAER